MALLPNKEFHQLVPKMREKGFYPAQKQREINWPIYNQNEIDNIIEVLNFIKNTVDKVELPLIKGKIGRPLTNPHSLAKAILICEELHLDERNDQGWLNIVGPRVGIREQLDDRVVGDASAKPEVIYILKEVFENTKDSNGIPLSMYDPHKFDYLSLLWCFRTPKRGAISLGVFTLLCDATAPLVYPEINNFPLEARLQFCALDTAVFTAVGAGFGLIGQTCVFPVLDRLYSYNKKQPQPSQSVTYT